MEWRRPCVTIISNPYSSKADRPTVLQLTFLDVGDTYVKFLPNADTLSILTVCKGERNWWDVCSGVECLWSRDVVLRSFTNARTTTTGVETSVSITWKKHHQPESETVALVLIMSASQVFLCDFVKMVPAYYKIKLLVTNVGSFNPVRSRPPDTHSRNTCG